MSDEIRNFTESKARILVIGVGGGGNKSINRMLKSNMEGVTFIAVNTDLQDLRVSKVSYKLQIGAKVTRGLGAGANPEIGRKAAAESKDQLADIIKDSDLVFIVTGLGGGTGTGAAPEISSIAKSLGVLNVPVVTIPFLYEGKKRLRQAQQGLYNIRENADAIIVINNQLLLENADEDIAMYEAFTLVDSVTQNAVQGITDLIYRPGDINVDFEDIKTILSNAGYVLIGIGEGIGDNRALDAARKAITSNLLEIKNIKGAQRLLINIAGSCKEQLTLFEVNKAASFITNEADENAEIIFGTSYNPELGDKVKVTAIVAGLTNGN